MLEREENQKDRNGARNSPPDTRDLPASPPVLFRTDEGQRLVVAATLQIMAQLGIDGLRQGCGKSSNLAGDRLKSLQMARGVPRKPLPIADDREPLLEGVGKGDEFRGLLLVRVGHFGAFVVERSIGGGTALKSISCVRKRRSQAPQTAVGALPRASRLLSRLRFPAIDGAHR